MANGTGRSPGASTHHGADTKIAAAELQRLADASEDDAAGRYIRHQIFATVIEDAVRRADAMLRLEASLRSSMRRRAA